jgi:hypothetical protein
MMKVKMILPALTEAKSPFFRPVKYSLFPPLGLATLAGYLDDGVEVTLRDEHVETVELDDCPDPVVINLVEQRKPHNLNRDYGAAIRRLHDLGVMVNGSFVFGMDGDDETVFGRTVEWAISQGIETATFHILTPYPGTALYERMLKAGRILHTDWDSYDTRHTVFRPTRMTPGALEKGYWRAYKEFYRWRSVMRGAATKPDLIGAAGRRRRTSSTVESLRRSPSS